MNKRLLIFSLILLICTFAASQSYHISTENIYKGYAKGIAKDIIVDKLGFLWMASDEGVFRFDGKKSLFFRDEIKGGYAKSFSKDKDDNILVVHDFGLTAIDSRPDTSIFNNILLGYLEYTDSSLHYPKSVYEDRDGTIWIGENTAIVRYNEGNFKKFAFELKDRSYDFYHSFSFTEDETGTLWAISFHGNLFYFNTQLDAFKEIPLNTRIDGVSDITYIQNAMFLVSARNGVFELRVENEQHTAEVRQIPGITNISSSAWIDNKDFYVGTWDQGLYRLNQENGNESWEKIAGIPFDDIIEVIYDPNNGIWVAGSQDFALLKPTVFDLFPLSDETLPIEAIHFQDEKNLLVGIGFEIFTLNLAENGWQITDVMNPFGRVITAICQDEQTLWIGGVGGEVFKYNIPKKELERIEIFSSSTTQVKQVLKDHHGNIWITGNETVGLGRISPEGELKFFTKGGLRKGRAMLETEKGDLFLCGGDADSYLFKYKPAEGEFEDISVDLPFTASNDFTVDDLCEDKNGNLFLASKDGLLLYSANPSSPEKTKIGRVDLGKVAVNEPIKALLRTDDTTIWLSTSSGLIVRSDTSSLLFDTSDGLPSNNLIYRGLQIDAKGNVWVGTARGLARLNHIAHIRKQTPTPIITSARVGRHTFRLSDHESLHIPYHTGLELNFQSLSFPVDKVQYQSRIPELSSEWSSASSDNYRLISDVPAGTYTFQLRAQQHAGYAWSELYSIPIVVEKPWFQKWWGIMAIASAIFLALYFSARLYNRNLLKQNEKLESIIKARTAEINTQKNQIIEQIEQNRKLKEAQLNSEIAYKNKKLTTHTLHLIQKNEALRDLRLKLITHIRNSKRKNLYAELQPVLAQIDDSLRQDKEWENFKLYFESVHSGFFEEIKKEYPALTPMELRHCALIRLNLSLQESATILGISADSVKTARFRLRKKMELPSQPALMSKIMET